MKIVYMGTPSFAVPPIKSILDAGHEILAVFTQPDRPKGRGYKETFSPVKEEALKYNLPLYQPQSMKGDEAKEILTTLSPELIAVVAYGQILPEHILRLPKYGCVNVHGSLLPKYRGAAPIQRSVIDGCAEVGVTTMLMDKGLDTGDILLTEKTPLLENETSGELYDRLSLLGADLLVKTIDALANSAIIPIPQNHEQATYAAMLNKEMAKLDFTLDAKTLINLINGVNPWPVAHTTFGGKLLKVYKAKAVYDMSGECGEVIDTKRFIVACKDGALELVEIQLEGSKRMEAKAFLAGRKLEKGIFLGR